jgi:hypothetical protein
MVVVLALALVVGACSSPAPTRSPAGTPSPTTQGSLDGCLAAGQGSLVDLGGGHQAAVLGSGASGVVLSNQSDQNLCGWLPFGKVLAERGFRVLLYDYGATADPAGDVALAAGKLRSLGVGTVQLVGASEGAKASLIAATTLQPPPAAVVSLSAERMLRGTDVLPAAAKLRVPVLFVTARDDGVVGEATSQLYRAASGSTSRRLEVVSGAAHGTELLSGAGRAKLQGTLVDFLRSHGGPPTTTTAKGGGSAVSARCGPRTPPPAWCTSAPLTAPGSTARWWAPAAPGWCCSTSTPTISAASGHTRCTWPARGCGCSTSTCAASGSRPARATPRARWWTTSPAPWPS